MDLNFALISYLEMEMSWDQGARVSGTPKQPNVRNRHVTSLRISPHATSREWYTVSLSRAAGVSLSSK
ncbi:hypothetical protein RRG08_038102 [Elysia crispata]|uniref:Uncharacterized protein n=1 Tax=Elysia crispata TaxID=231223 RepID=A0AAE1DPV3_9GAST|nr:hypothetical protein RRG08_038102 [Elysia crispata]